MPLPYRLVPQTLAGDWVVKGRAEGRETDENQVQMAGTRGFLSTLAKALKGKQATERSRRSVAGLSPRAATPHSQRECHQTQEADAGGVRVWGGPRLHKGVS